MSAPAAGKGPAYERPTQELKGFEKVYLAAGESRKVSIEVPLEDLKRTWMAKIGGDKLSCIFISAKEKENIEELRDTLYKRVRELHVQKYPYNDFLYQTPS